MHWRTYHRLLSKQLNYANDAWRDSVLMLKRMDARFAELEKWFD